MEPWTMAGMVNSRSVPETPKSPVVFYLRGTPPLAWLEMTWFGSWAITIIRAPASSFIWHIQWERSVIFGL
jgi:hypothetical protein